MAKRKLDKFDLEAEREGNAVKKFLLQQAKKPVGKKVSAERSMYKAGNSVIVNKVLRNLEFIREK